MTAVGVDDVDDGRFNANALAAKLAGEGGDGFAAVEREDRRALIAEMPAQLLADAAGRPGDGDDLVLELHFTRLRRPPGRRQSS